MTLAASIICDLFDNVLCLRHVARNYGMGHDLMWLAFETNNRQLNMALYAPHNYVGVYAAWSAYTESLESIAGWRCASYHDSCWRSDGVERIMSAVEDLGITSLAHIAPGIHVAPIPDTTRAVFAALARHEEPQQYVTAEFLRGIQETPSTQEKP